MVHLFGPHTVTNNKIVTSLVIGTDDVVRRRRYCDHFVTMYVGVYVCGYVSTIKRKLLIGMT